MSLASKVDEWVTKMRAKINYGGINVADLDQLHRSIITGKKITRQRLLYLHAASPNIRSNVVSMAEHEPMPGTITEITGASQEWPYDTVHDAILDGWQIVHFPDQRAPFDDTEIDILGYEFILQKLEEYDE